MCSLLSTATTTMLGILSSKELPQVPIAFSLLRLPNRTFFPQCEPTVKTTCEWSVDTQVLSGVYRMGWVALPHFIGLWKAICYSNLTTSPLCSPGLRSQWTFCQELVSSNPSDRPQEPSRSWASINNRAHHPSCFCLTSDMLESLMSSLRSTSEFFRI